MTAKQIFVVEVHIVQHDVFSKTFSELGPAQRFYDRHNPDGEIITDVRFWATSQGSAKLVLREKKGRTDIKYPIPYTGQPVKEYMRQMREAYDALSDAEREADYQQVNLCMAYGMTNKGAQIHAKLAGKYEDG